MTRGIKIRLIAFLIVSAVGIVYVAGSYLGVVDKLLGRGMIVHATLPASGGLFVGSEVTYRGVKVGKVSAMQPTKDGLIAELALREGAKIPRDSQIFVHNLSAVGEQYLDFEPSNGKGPYLMSGASVKGDRDSIPIGEEVLLTNLSRFVVSINQQDLPVSVRELGLMFRDNATPLRKLVDNGSEFIGTANANRDATIDLINQAAVVLETQADNRENIASFSSDLGDLTGAVRAADGDIRTIVNDAPLTAREAKRLVDDLRPVAPGFLRHTNNVTRVLAERRPALEQLLVTFPRLVSLGPTALTPGRQKFGRVNLNLNQTPGPCTDGYLPPGQRRPTEETTFVDYYPAECKSGSPVNMRGMKHAPPVAGLKDGAQ